MELDGIATKIDRTQIDILVERLQKADGPDTDIDKDIARLLGFYIETRAGKPMIMREPTKRGAPAWNLPPYTATIDGARMLMEQLLPGWTHEENRSPRIDGNSKVTCRIWNNRRGDNYRVVLGTHRCSEPIAICIATLSAKSELQGMDEFDLWGRAR